MGVLQYMHHDVDSVANLNPTVCPNIFSPVLLLVSPSRECLPRAALLGHSQ